MSVNIHTLPENEQRKLAETPLYIIQYMAPMMCGERERAELHRRNYPELHREEYERIKAGK